MWWENCKTLHAIVDTNDNDVSHTGNKSVLSFFNLVAANDPAYEPSESRHSPAMPIHQAMTYLRHEPSDTERRQAPV